MAIRFTCPHCGISTDVGEQFAGQSGPCRQCGQKVVVPIPGASNPAYAGSDKAGPPSAPSRSSGSAVIAVAIVAALGLLLIPAVLVALLLPAVQAAREAARRMSCSNNLKQIALAMHNYHDAYKSFPPAYTVDEQGNQLHSWRTLILPFLEQSALYRNIDLDEPWDSPKNAAFNDVRIPVYSCPSGSPTASCHYRVVVGKGTLFPGETAMTIRDVTDGTSNTLLVVESHGLTGSWMEPVDLDEAQIAIAFGSGPTEPGSTHPGGFMISTADGAVRFVADSIDPKVFRALLTAAGDEILPGNY